VAQHQVQAPDGTVYTVEAPEATSDEDLIAFAVDHHAQQTQPRMADVQPTQNIPMHQGMEHTAPPVPINNPVGDYLAPKLQHPMAEFGKGVESAFGTPDERRANVLKMTGKPYNEDLAKSYNDKVDNTAIGAAGVIKPVGGQWLEGVERALKPLKKPEFKDTHLNEEENADVNEHRTAINKWIDGNLRKYVLNRMATPEDEIRKLADDGITHHSPTPKIIQAEQNRVAYKDDAAPESKTEAGQRWENATDSIVRNMKAGSAGDIWSGVSLNDKPWVNKLDSETALHQLSQARGSVNQTMHQDLGFDHIIDTLGEKLATGEIRPEQLNKVSVADAVRMTHNSNEAAAKKMADAKKAAQEGMTIHKEYPEGWKWIKLDKPGQFAAESDEMGHSVRGYEPPKSKARSLGTERHPDWVEASGDSGSESYGHGGWDAIKSGKAEVYSLKDPKGNSKATVEVGSNTGDLQEKALEWMTQEHPKVQQGSGIYWHLVDEYAAKLKASREKSISQIKGPQNRRPSDDALPFIQDFVKSKKWSNVKDLQNSGMTQEELRAHQATFSK
jgi:hypothetical protein